MSSVAVARHNLPNTRLMSILLVLSAATLTAAAAQWEIRLPFTPVPVTGQTLAVLISGAVLGWRLGGLSQVVYLASGVFGAPVFSGGGSGVEVITGSTGGYLVGFVFAAVLIGKLSERGQDRTFATMFTAFIAATLLIYLFGVAGLIGATGWPVTEAVAKGVVPFLLGDLIKAAAAGVLVPTAWKLSPPKR